MAIKIGNIVKIILAVAIIAFGISYGLLMLIGTGLAVSGLTQTIIWVVISALLIFGGPLIGFKLIKSTKNK